MQKIILTGDRPTGRLHIGHYVGSLRRRVELQNSGAFDRIFIMIADAQALTDNADNPEKVRQNIIEVALDYMSCGLDPEKSVLFIQSQVSELTELTFFYPGSFSAKLFYRGVVVGNKQEGSAAAEKLFDALLALHAEARIADCKHLIGDNNICADAGGDSEAEP